MFVWTCYSFSLTTNSVSFSPFFDGENRKRVQISRSFFPTCFQSVKHAINKSPTQEIVLKNRGGREENFCLIPLCLGRVIKTLPLKVTKKEERSAAPILQEFFTFGNWRTNPIESLWPLIFDVYQFNLPSKVTGHFITFVKGKEIQALTPPALVSTCCPNIVVSCTCLTRHSHWIWFDLSYSFKFIFFNRFSVGCCGFFSLRLVPS